MGGDLVGGLGGGEVAARVKRVGAVGHEPAHECRHGARGRLRPRKRRRLRPWKVIKAAVKLMLEATIPWPVASS